MIEWKDEGAFAVARLSGAILRVTAIGEWSIWRALEARPTDWVRLCSGKVYSSLTEPLS